MGDISIRPDELAPVTFKLSGSGKHFDVAQRLRDEPGKWFALTSRPTLAAAWSFAYQIGTGRRAAFRPAGSFQGRTEGTCVFARFIQAEDEVVP